jgi:hypothetical protein
MCNLEDDESPQVIRDFARTILRSPSVFPDYSPDRQRTPDGAREKAPAKVALWLHRSLPDDA